MENSQYEQTEKCPKCHKQIAKLNFIIHEAMCRGARQSFIMNVNDAEFKKIFSKEEKEENERKGEQEKKPLYPQLEKPKEPKGKEPEKKPPKEIKKTNSADDKFPCSYCGYMMNMQELDTHPPKCAMHTVQCLFCKLDYPEQLLDDHKSVCEKRPREPQRPREPERPREPQRQQMPPSQHRNNNSPPRGQIQRYRRTQNYISKSISTSRDGRGRDIAKITRRYPNGDETLQIVIDDYEEQPEHLIRPGRLQQEDDQDEPIFIFSNGGNQRLMFPAMFFNSGSNGRNDIQVLIQHLMNGMQIDRRQNPGIDERDIRKLPVVEFNKETNGKHSPSCTICIKDYNDGDVLIQLPCGHLFNKQCIFPWLKTSSVCPNCRNPVKGGRRQQSQDD